MPIIIGITGSIATGKSTACDIMANLGAFHCDADKLVHRLYDPGKPAFDRVVAIFGSEIVGDDGFIDRKILGSKVFGKPDEMKKLTDAIGDIAAAVKEVVYQWNQELGENDIALLEAVNLIEAGYGRWCNQVWLFAADRDTALERLMARNGFSSDEANQRLSSQRSWEERAPASDLVIFNDGSKHDFERRVRSEFANLVEKAKLVDFGPSKYQGWWNERESQKE